MDLSSWTNSPQKVHKEFGNMERRYGAKLLELECLMGLPDVTDPAFGDWDLSSTPRDILINELDFMIDNIMDRTKEPSPDKFSVLFGEWYHNHTFQPTKKRKH